MSTMTFTITGEVNVEITVTELADGTLKFDLTVLDETGSIGDLNALFLDFADDSLTDGMVITGDDVTGTALKQDGVTKVDSYTNMNGEVVNDLGKFDAGIQFGTQGIGEDDIRSTSFILSNTDVDLTLETIALQDFGIRLTSVGEEGGTRDGSLKLGDTAPDAPVAGAIAVEDIVFVNSDSGLGDADMFEFINGEVNASILDNDTNTDGTAYTGTVTAVNGDEANVGQLVPGSNGGYLLVTADGTTDFTAYDADGVNEFGHLAAFEIQDTEFTYTIEGGATTTLIYSVSGVGDLGGGGGDGGGGIFV